jgi:hypothetical protein
MQSVAFTCSAITNKSPYKALLKPEQLENRHGPHAYGNNCND